MSAARLYYVVATGLFVVSFATLVAVRTAGGIVAASLHFAAMMLAVMSIIAGAIALSLDRKDRQQ